MNTRKGLWLISVGTVTFLLCLPFVRLVADLSDEGVLLHGAARILEGKIIYRDFFEFLPPGGFLLTASWLNLFGNSLLASRLLLLLVISGIACLIFICCQRVTNRTGYSALIAVFWVLLTQGTYTQLNHHWLTTFFSMSAFLAALNVVSIIQKRQFNILLLAFFSGISCMITPTRGALSLLAGLICIWNRSAKLNISVIYFITALIPTALCIGYLIKQGALYHAFENVIMNTSTNYTAIQIVPFGYGTSFFHPLVLVFPITVILSLIFILFKSISLEINHFKVCSAFAFVAILGSYPRPDIVHLFFTTPLIMPLFALVTKNIIAWPPRKYLIAPIAFIASILILSVQPYMQHVKLSFTAKTVNVANGYIKTSHTSLISFLNSTPIDDSFFFYPFNPMLPYLTKREHVATFDVIYPGYTTAEQYKEICLTVIDNAEWVIMLNSILHDEHLTNSYPSLSVQRPVERKYFEGLLLQHFSLIKSLDGMEIRKRNLMDSSSQCENILSRTL